MNTILDGDSNYIKLNILDIRLAIQKMANRINKKLLNVRLHIAG